MKTYRETLDALRFTPQQKAAIAEDLLAAAQAGQVRAPRRKWGRVAAAAILAAALCAACASGALQEALARTDRASCASGALQEALSCGCGYVIDCQIDIDEMVRPMVPAGAHITDFLLK